MVTESIVGAVVLAASALSSGMHLVNHKRLTKLEKKEKIRNIEVSVLEYTVLTGIGVGLINKYAVKKEEEIFKQQIEAKIAGMEGTVARIETRVAGTQIDTVKAQNDLLNEKIDHIVNAVDISLEDQTK